MFQHAQTGRNLIMMDHVQIASKVGQHWIRGIVLVVLKKRENG